MNKKVTFILLSSFLCTSALNGMSTAKKLSKSALRGSKSALSTVNTTLKRNPIKSTLASTVIGATVVDGVRGFPVARAAGKQAKRAFGTTKNGIVTVSTKVKDVVKAHPHRATSVVAGTALATGATVEVIKGLPVSRALGRGLKASGKGILSICSTGLKKLPSKEATKKAVQKAYANARNFVQKHPKLAIGCSAVAVITYPTILLAKKAYNYFKTPIVHDGQSRPTTNN